MRTARGRAARRAAIWLLVLSACSASHRQRAADPAAEGSRRLKAAERDAQSGSDPEAQVRAGWLRYLVGSDPLGAGKLADAALAATASAKPDSREAEVRALALALRGELLDDRLDTLGASKAWAELLSVAPASGLSELAGARLLDAEGDSLAVDTVVAAAAAKIAVGTDPRGARLLREAAARVASRADSAQRRPVPEEERAAWLATGAVQHWRVAGPFASLRRIDLEKATALDGAAEAAAPTEGPAGRVGDRELDVPDGDLGLELESNDGDLYYAASELSVSRGGDYLAWLEGSSAIELRLDGAVVLARSPYPRELPRAQQVAVRLGAGPHQLLARFTRAEGTRFRLVIARADGGPSDVSSAAPAVLRGKRNPSPCPLGGTCAAAPAWSDARGLRGAAEKTLDRDPDDPIATFLLARAALGDDRTVARGALERLLALTGGSAPALVLHAQALLRDAEVPDRVARARALGELTAAADKAPQTLRARLSAASLQRDAERFDDAALLLDRAEATAAALWGEPGKPAELPPRLILSRARLLDSRGNATAARNKVEAALAADAGRCDARQMLYDLARREGGLEEQVRFAEALLPCPDGRTQLASLLAERSRRPEAIALLQQHAAARPAIPQRLEQIADLLSNERRFAEAADLLQKAAVIAPRSAEPHRRLSGVLDLAGDAAGAKAERRAALLHTPADLNLRRQVAHDENLALLTWADRDAVPVAKSTPIPSKPEAAAVRLLDLGAVEIFPGGGAVERVHTLTRVLDKKGISRFGEAHLPADSQLLRLRTIKPDGAVLEPEAIPGKESVSLPGLEPGDAIEIDYLRALPPRGPEVPGQSLGSFFFRDDETELHETSYEVRAPEAIPLEVEARQLKVEPIAKKDGQLRFRYAARDVKPLQPEPHAPPENETMPWVQVGWGGNQADLMRAFADWALLRARPGAATDALAAAAGGSTPRQKAENVWAAVAQAVRGRSSGTDLNTPAAHVLALGRGNRLALLKAALASAGVASHVALVRPFGADPSAYRFPRADLFNYGVLRVDLPEGPLWVDPSYRLAPFGRLPVFARGQAAWILPEPGEEPALVQTPSEEQNQDGRTLALDLAVDAEGLAAGEGRDEHLGFEAASLKDSLEKMDKDHRKQGVEAMLSRGLRGVALEGLQTERESEAGGSGTLVYRLKAQLGRKEGRDLALPASALPARLTRRWAQKAERTLPLLFDAAENQTLLLSVRLPQGYHLEQPPRPVEVRSRFGLYRWSAQEEAGPAGAPAKVVLREELRLPLQRIAPADYPAFVQFVRAVDAAQEAELRVLPQGTSAPTPVAGAAASP